MQRTTRSRARKLTLFTTLAMAAVIGGWDVLLLVDGVEGNTISSVFQTQGWALGLVGYAAVHVARKPDGRERSWLVTGVGALCAAGSAEMMGGGVAGMAMGGAFSWVAWGNSGKT